MIAVAAACTGKRANETPAPAPPSTAPLPSAGLAGQKVPLFPLTLVGAEDTLHWDALVADRRATLDLADSILGGLLVARVPEVGWVTPAELRRMARRAAGVATDPDRMGTAFLRAERLVHVPDPLRSQLRTLAALSDSRYALIPAGLVYRRTVGRTDGRTVIAPSGIATAELSVVLVDTRLGRVGWRTVARGEGDDPWTALTRAVKRLTPGVP